MADGRTAVAVLPLALGLVGGVLSHGAVALTGLSTDELLILESTPVEWPSMSVDSAEPNFVFGPPRYRDDDPEHDILLKYHGFSVYYDDVVMGPRWTAIKLTSAMADENSDFKRPGRFVKDQAIEAAGLHATTHDDYRNSPGSRDWARGHLVQFDDARGWGDQSGRDSFFTSNIVPQLEAHNSHGWLALEMTATEDARDFGVVWVYAGPIYEPDLEPFLPGRVVPAPIAFYKILVSPTEDGTVGIQAFRMPHQAVARNADMAQFLVSIDEIEQETEIDFLPALPDQIESILEATTWSLWPDIEDN